MKELNIQQAITEMPSPITGIKSLSVDSAISALTDNGLAYTLKYCPKLLEESDEVIVSLLLDSIPEQATNLFASNLDCRFRGTVLNFVSRCEFFHYVNDYKTQTNRSFFVGDVLVICTMPTIVIGFHHEGEILSYPNPLQINCDS